MAYLPVIGYLLTLLLVGSPQSPQALPPPPLIIIMEVIRPSNKGASLV